MRTNKIPSGDMIVTTILEYKTSMTKGELAKLEEEIRKKCKCGVKIDEQKKIFELSNSQVPSKPFLNFEGIQQKILNMTACLLYPACT